MKILQFGFVILFIATCADSSLLLEKNFKSLFQSSYKMLKAKEELFKKNVIQVQQNGLVYTYDVFIEQITILIAKGTNRLTGIDTKYIIEVLEGQNQPPFQNSLKCVKERLIELQEAIFESRKLIKFMKNLYKAPKLNFKTCDDVTDAVDPHLNLILEVIDPFVRGYKEYVPTFENLNMLDLFTNFWKTKVKFDMEAIAIITANVLNADEQEAIDHINGINKNLSFPLSCAENVLDLCVSQMRAAYNSVLEKN